MLTICYSFLQLWATFAAKLMKRPTFFFFFFFNILKLSLYFYMFTKLHDHKILLKNAVRFNMWTKSCLFQQLWTIFSTKIMKYHTIFVTYFWSLFQFLHCDAVLLWPHFYSKNDSCFNVANKMLFISKGMLLTPFLSCFFYHLLFQIFAISAKHYHALGKLCYWTLLFRR